MKIHKKSQSKSKVSQKYNLKELLGYKPTSEQKELFFNLAVDKIVTRTADGRDVNGRPFKEYSEKYAEKKGVSRGAVDLILKGDMLSAFEENLKQPNMVEIKIEGGVDAKKAYNHDIGDTLPKREFFGFKKESDLLDIVMAVDSIKDQEDANTGSSTASQTMDLVALRAAISQTLTAEFEGFNDTEEGILNAALLSTLRGEDG